MNIDYIKIAEMFENAIQESLEEGIEDLQEAGRYKIVNRVRKGKIQLRKKVSNREHYTFRNGKLIRMTAQERRRRAISQKKGARKRKAKAARIRRKTMISMRKAKRLPGRG